MHLAADARRRHVRLLEMALCRLVRFGRRVLDQTELDRLVAVGLRRLRLHDDARPGLDDRRRHHAAVGLEDLGHAHFPSDDSSHHKALFF